MSRSSVFSSLASQEVTAAELDQLDTTSGVPSETTFLRGDKTWVAPAADAATLNSIQTNISLLAFKIAVNGSLAKYSLVDQVIDEYAHVSDISGIDASASTNQTLVSGYYQGGVAAGLTFRYWRLTISAAVYHDNNAGFAVATFRDGVNASGTTVTSTNGFQPSYYTGSGGMTATAGVITNALLTASANLGYTTNQSGQYLQFDFGEIYSGVEKLYIGKNRVNGDPTQYTLYTSTTGAVGEWTLVPSAGSGMTFNATKGGTSFDFSHQATGVFTLTPFGSSNDLGYSTIEGNDLWGIGIADLVLQSTDTTAEAVPTKADIVMLIEDAGSGVGALNTDIKAYISRDSGVHVTDSWTQATLTDEGDWGTDKRIVVAHDVSLTAKNSGQEMCYKITTHNADATKDTRIHATSIGWK